MSKFVPVVHFFPTSWPFILHRSVSYVCSCCSSRGNCLISINVWTLGWTDGTLFLPKFLKHKSWTSNCYLTSGLKMDINYYDNVLIYFDKRCEWRVSEDILKSIYIVLLIVHIMLWNLLQKKWTVNTCYHFQYRYLLLPISIYKHH